MSNNCRLCLTQESEVYSEMDTDNCLKQLKSVIPEIDLSLTESPLICTNCSDLLQSAYIFKLNCLEVEEKLRLYLNESEIRTESKPESVRSELETQDTEDISIEQTIDYSDDLGQHVKNELVFSCNDIPVVSNDSISEKPSLREDPLKQKAENKYLCKFCEVKLSTYRDWYEHIKVHAGTNNVCDICSKTFSTRSQLLSHKDTHRINKCPFCGQEFLYKSTFSKHIKEQHTEEKSLEGTAGSHFIGAAGKYECNMCGLKTKEKCQLIEHIRTHTGERPYKCSLCDKAFAQSSTLSTHIKGIHLTDRPYQCEICGKGYAVRGAYTVHMKTHEDLPKSFVCNHCGKGFTMQGRLNEHLHRHNAEKFIVCHVCSKSFTDKKGFTKHMRIHTGEKPYECPICEKRFTQQYNMRIHLRSCARKNRYIKTD